MWTAQEIIVQNQRCCSKLHGCVHQSHGRDRLYQEQHCTFWNASGEPRTVVHGDVSATMGYDDELAWFKGEMEKKFERNHKGESDPLRMTNKSRQY